MIRGGAGGAGDGAGGPLGAIAVVRDGASPRSSNVGSEEAGGRWSRGGSSSEGGPLPRGRFGMSSVALDPIRAKPSLVGALAGGGIPGISSVPRRENVSIEGGGASPRDGPVEG